MSAFEMSGAFRVNHRLLQEELTIIEAKPLFTDWTNHLARKCRFAGEEWKVRSEVQQVCCLTSNGVPRCKVPISVHDIPTGLGLPVAKS